MTVIVLAAMLGCSQILPAPPAPAPKAEAEPEPHPAAPAPAREFVEANEEKEARALFDEARAQVLRADTLGALWRVLQAGVDSESLVAEIAPSDQVMVIRKYYLAAVLPEPLQAAIRDYDGAVGQLRGAMDQYSRRLQAVGRPAAVSADSTAEALQAYDAFATSFDGFAQTIGEIRTRLAGALTAEDSLQVVAGFAHVLEDLATEATTYRNRVAELRGRAGPFLEVRPGTAIAAFDSLLNQWIGRVDAAALRAKEVEGSVAGIAASDEALAFVVGFGPIVSRFERETASYRRALDEYRQRLRFAASPADSNAVFLSMHRRTQAFVDTTARMVAHGATLEAALHQEIAREEAARRSAQLQEAVRLWNEQAAPKLEDAVRADERRERVAEERKAQLRDDVSRRYSEAETRLRECVHLDPTQTIYRKSLCYALQRQADFERESSRPEAEGRLLEALLRIDKSDFGRHSIDTLRPRPSPETQDSYRRTIASWQEALDQDRGDEEIYAALAHCHHELGEDFDAAVRYAQRALRVLMVQGFARAAYPEGPDERSRIEQAIARYKTWRDDQRVEENFDPSSYATGPVDTLHWALREYQLATSLYESGRGAESVAAIERILTLPDVRVTEAGLDKEDLRRRFVEPIRSFDYDTRRLALLASARKLSRAREHAKAHEVYAALADSLHEDLGTLLARHEMSLLEWKFLGRRDDAVRGLRLVWSRLLGDSTEKATALAKKVGEDYGAACLSLGHDSVDRSRAQAQVWYDESAGLPWSGRGKAYAALAELYQSRATGVDRAIELCRLAHDHRAGLEAEEMRKVFKVWQDLLRRDDRIEELRQVQELKTAYEAAAEAAPSGQE
jgi:tetratricopeptide (TPR) repeat protein